MRHKITNVSQPTNEIEAQKVKDAKSFTGGIIGLVASTAIGFVGMAVYTSTIASGDASMVPVALGVIMQIVSHGVATPKLIGHLQNLYDRKGNEQQINDANDLSGGMKK